MKQRCIPKDWRTRETIGVMGLKLKPRYEKPSGMVGFDDIPKLLTTKEVAEMLRKHPKTVEEYRRDGSLKFLKIRGRYFTTPCYLAEFLEMETR